MSVFNRPTKFLSVAVTTVWGMALLSSMASAQLVGLPAPRLLTVMPMGGQAGTTVDVTVTGEHLDDPIVKLVFSAPGITSTQKTGADGKALPGQFVVTIAPDAPVGICEARVETEMGVSTSRAFTIGKLKEVIRTAPSNSVEKAFPVEVNSICNAQATKSAVDFYKFDAKKGARTIIECVARGIDSKLVPVLIVADDKGRDLKVDRQGGIIDYIAPADGTYVIKVHDLTFQGGPYDFYRLALTSASPSAPLTLQPSTSAVNAFSIPPEGLAAALSAKEVEPNNKHPQAQKITLPCDISGQFFPAADVDTFEFTGKKGEVWWVEAVSERRGLGTNPFAVVQRVVTEAGQERLVDVAEFSDIASPIKVSSNGYSYDGPPYNAGSADFLGKFSLPEEGTYRLQMRDLYGGTRSNPRNTYRLIVRRPTPDFAVVAWALHMNLRNGDRAALSKPISLRPGATMLLEVIVLRKDDFNGPIELAVENLPTGMSATGLTIPAGQSVGKILISAQSDAAPVSGVAHIIGRAKINNETQTRECPLAFMTWPVRDAKQEIPAPRLMVDVPVSIARFEGAPVTIAPAEEKVWTVKEGETLTIPLKLTWRSEFSGAFKLKSVGSEFAKMKEFDVPLGGATVNAILNLADMKTPPGEYTFALYGGAVAKYRERMDRLKIAEQEVAAATEQVKTATAAVEAAKSKAQTAPADQKGAADAAVKAAMATQTTAEKAKTAAEAKLKAATTVATPKEIVDIMVSTPMHIVVEPAKQETAQK